MDEMTPEKIRSLREQMGLTQAQFAYRLGVSFATVNRWERGHYRPTPLAERLLRRLETSERRKRG